MGNLEIRRNSDGPRGWNVALKEEDDLEEREGWRRGWRGGSEVLKRRSFRKKDLDEKHAVSGEENKRDLRESAEKFVSDLLECVGTESVEAMISSMRKVMTVQAMIHSC